MTTRSSIKLNPNLREGILLDGMKIILVLGKIAGANRISKNCADHGPVLTLYGNGSCVKVPGMVRRFSGYEIPAVGHFLRGKEKTQRSAFFNLQLLIFNFQWSIFPSILPPAPSVPAVWGMDV
jgi:hypothetical protein